MEAEAFRPPGESASPLEMLGEGAMGSHRIVQTAVPLGTRKTSLQILDDLSLFFVDMRATLLLRTATAGPIMDELCLKAETFEEAVVCGNLGEVVVCIPQLYKIPHSVVVDCSPLPQFVKPRSALQEAGILDGDLITHINGQRVSVDWPEDHFLSLQPVKGVQLLDLAFLRATGESSAEGYPWHEALAFWKSGVRRHILDDAELGPSRQWMRQANDLRARESIRNYRLCREFTTQDATGKAITSFAYPRHVEAAGGTAPVAHGDTNHCSRSTGSTPKQHKGHNTGNDRNNSKGSSSNNSSSSRNNHSGEHLCREPNGVATGRRGGIFVMSSSKGSSQGGGGGAGGAGAGRTGMMMTPQQPRKDVQPQTEDHAPQLGLVPARGGSGVVAGGTAGMWVRQPVAGGTMNGGSWRPRMTISGAAPQGPSWTSPCELKPPSMAHHSQHQQQQGIVNCGGNGGGDTQLTRGSRSSSSCSNNIPIVNNLNSSSGYGGCPAPTAFSGAPVGKMAAHPLPSTAANSLTGGVLTRPIQPRQVSSGGVDASRGRNTDDRSIDRASGLDKAAAAAGAEGRGGGQGSSDKDGDRGPENGKRRRLSCDYCAKKKTKCSGGVWRCLRCRRDDQECVYSPNTRTGPPKRRRVAAVAAGKANASTAENGPVNNNNNGSAGSGGGSGSFGSGGGGVLGMTPVFPAVSPGTVRHPAAPPVRGNGGGDIVDIAGSSAPGSDVGGIGNGFFGVVGGGGGSDGREGAVPGDRPAGVGRDEEIWDPRGFGHSGRGGGGVMMMADPGVATKPFRFTEASLNLPRSGASVVGSGPRNGSGGGAEIGDGGGVAPQKAGDGKESNSSAGEQCRPFPGAVGGDSSKSGVESDGGDGEERESPREERVASDPSAMGSLEGAGKGGGGEGEAAAVAVAGQGGEDSDTMPLRPSHGSRSGPGGSGYNSNSSDGGGADGLAKISTRTRNKTAAKAAVVAEAARAAQEATAATPKNAVPQSLSPLPPSADLPLPAGKGADDGASGTGTNRMTAASAAAFEAGPGEVSSLDGAPIAYTPAVGKTSNNMSTVLCVKSEPGENIASRSEGSSSRRDGTFEVRGWEQ
ncbi:unnamed protein product [Ectocarpus sp. CCAP 1310/34]|nr:unnamed protein product [Ectocarpus sp. CCAP 1310/34]